MDKEKLDYWKTIITFLHNVLGDNYEIVLHVVDEILVSWLIVTLVDEP